MQCNPGLTIFGIITINIRLPSKSYCPEGVWPPEEALQDSPRVYIQGLSKNVLVACEASRFDETRRVRWSRLM